MDERILEQLYKPFELKERKGVGNKTFKYVPTEDIVDRMNRVFKGNWSTEVRHFEVIEDQILICVRVYARDPNNNEEDMWWQEGYASHSLAKYTSGPNNGKIIDVGNSYKSAMSKAIKTAVSKWGVGLNLESDDSYSSDTGSLSPFPEMPTGSSSNIPSVPDFTVPEVVAPAQKITSTETPKSVVSNDPFEMPPFDTPPVSNKAPSPSPTLSPFDEGPPVMSSQVSNVEPNTQPVSDFVVPPEKNELLTDIQKVAIETHMATYNITLQKLAEVTLKRTDNLPTSLDTISYQDAVKIIQNGNHLRS